MSRKKMDILFWATERLTFIEPSKQKKIKRALINLPYVNQVVFLKQKEYKDLGQELQKLTADKLLLVSHFLNTEDTDIVIQARYQPGDYSLLDLKDYAIELYSRQIDILDKLLARIRVETTILIKKRKPTNRRVKYNPRTLVYGSGISGLSIASKLADSGKKVDIMKTPANLLSPGFLNLLLTDTKNLINLLKCTYRHKRISFIPQRYSHFINADDGKYFFDAQSGSQNKYGTIVFCPELSEEPPINQGAINLTWLYTKILSRYKFNGDIIIITQPGFEHGAAVYIDILQAALYLQKTFNTQVWILWENAQISMLEMDELYTKCRECGVIFVKYKDKPHIKKNSTELMVRVFDSQTGQEFVIHKPESLVTVMPVALSDTAINFAQDLNIRLVNNRYTQTDSLWRYPNQTNRAGVFTVGAAKAEQNYETFKTDISTVVSDIINRLQDGHTSFKELIPVVDKEKCVYCLTCLRLCPHGAIGKNLKDRLARVITSACEACGICVANCPAEALQTRNLKNQVLYASIKNLI